MSSRIWLTENSILVTSIRNSTNVMNSYGQMMRIDDENNIFNIWVECNARQLIVHLCEPVVCHLGIAVQCRRLIRAESGI